MYSQCPNCRATVSNRNYDCPGCGGPLRKAPREMAGPVFRWSFVVFNALMTGWFAFYLLTGRTSLRPPAIDGRIESDLVAVGAPVAGEAGLVFLGLLWAMGFIVLGLSALGARQPIARHGKSTYTR